ncbi:hypothetical protein EON83_26050 [bacterium]|nr:MAG: hypothetical protein EON83_26050 [bacterium]
MDKKLSAKLALTPEWTLADEALKEDSKSIAIELRQFQMPEKQLITTAYKQINGDVLPELSSKARSALLELAKLLGRNANNSWMFAFTRVEEAEAGSGGLRHDERRVKLLALTGKFAVDNFFKKVVATYGDDLQTARPCGFTGLGWGKPQQQFLLLTIPLEKLPDLKDMAEHAGFKLSETAPRDMVTNKQTHRTRMVEYPTELFDEENLLYLARVQQEVAYAKPNAKDKSRAV